MAAIELALVEVIEVAVTEPKVTTERVVNPLPVTVTTVAPLVPGGREIRVTIGTAT